MASGPVNWEAEIAATVAEGQAKQASSATSAPMHAISLYSDEVCRSAGEAYMVCKNDNNRDPSKCVQQAAAVRACMATVFKKVKSECAEDFTQYWVCLDSQNQGFQYCRKEEKKFAQCAVAKLGIGKERLDLLEQGALASWRKI